MQYSTDTRKLIKGINTILKSEESKLSKTDRDSLIVIREKLKLFIEDSKSAKKPNSKNNTTWSSKKLFDILFELLKLIGVGTNFLKDHFQDKT